jgi:hypothetical protein
MNTDINSDNSKLLCCTGSIFRVDESSCLLPIGAGMVA